MPRPLQLVPSIPSVSAALERFLARSRFAARTRESYAQDLAPLLARLGERPIASLAHADTATFLAAHEHLAASTFNRRYAALRSFVRWCRQQGWLDEDPLSGLERRPQPRTGPRALDPEQVEAVLRGIRDVRDRALFWLIYDGGLRCQEALGINIEDIDWAERAIRIVGKGNRAREMFFSRRLSRYLDDYLKQRGEPTVGPLFITARKARSPNLATTSFTHTCSGIDEPGERSASPFSTGACRSPRLRRVADPWPTRRRPQGLVAPSRRGSAPTVES
jgi:integrase/recombinase XerD